MRLQATVAEYRDVMCRGLEQVRIDLSSGKTTEDEARHVFREYRTLFGIIDSLTADERSDPLRYIDSGRLRRIARGAGATDQDVIGFLISYNQFREFIARENLRNGYRCG